METAYTFLGVNVVPAVVLLALGIGVAGSIRCWHTEARRHLQPVLGVRPTRPPPPVPPWPGSILVKGRPQRIADRDVALCGQCRMLPSLWRKGTATTGDYYLRCFGCGDVSEFGKFPWQTVVAWNAAQGTSTQPTRLLPPPPPYPGSRRVDAVRSQVGGRDVQGCAPCNLCATLWHCTSGYYAGYYLRCGQCGYTGQSCETKRQAADAWNTAQSLSPRPPLVIARPARVEVCAACGVAPVRKHVDEDLQWFECPGCGKQGPAHGTRREAAEAWNAAQGLHPITGKDEPAHAPLSRTGRIMLGVAAEGGGTIVYRDYDRRVFATLGVPADIRWRRKPEPFFRPTHEGVTIEDTLDGQMLYRVMREVLG